MVRTPHATRRTLEARSSSTAPLSQPNALSSNDNDVLQTTSPGSNEENPIVEIGSNVENSSAGQHLKMALRNNQQVEVDDSGRVRARVKFGGFVYSSVTRDIADIIRHYFLGPWIDWKHVPAYAQTSWWNTFKQKHFWYPEEESLVHATWLKTAKEAYRKNILGYARQLATKQSGTDDPSKWKNHRPNWIKQEIWDELLVQWQKPDFVDKRNKNKQNRVTKKDGEITKHTCGSVSVATHRYRMELQQDKSISELEVYDLTHRRDKGKGCYVDNKSKSVKEKYTAIVSEKYSQDPSSQPEFDPQAWISATRAPLKGRVYGFVSSGQSSFLISDECSSHIFDKNNALETLYTKEEVQQQIHETINKMRAEIEAECVKKMEEKMEEKMKTYLGNIGSNHSDEDNGSGA